MSIKTTTLVHLVCDGCGATTPTGGDTGFVRSRARREGWTIFYGTPELISKRDPTVKEAPMLDRCPTCSTTT